MGCCFSRESDGSPYSEALARGYHGDSSSRAITGPGQTSSSEAGAPQRTSTSRPQSDFSTTPRASHSNPRRHLPPSVPLSEHYNQPIRVHVWKSKRRTWSHAQLAREREEFFDTRVTGKPEIWAALSSATSLMRDGDLVTAQTILDAAGITVPTGDLTEGCYDENGVLYRLPEAIVADPQNVTEGTSEEEEETKYRSTGCLGEEDVSGSKLAVDADSDEELVGELNDDADEKGKRTERELIRVCVRLSDRGGPDLTIVLGKEQSVSTLARKVQNDAGLTASNRVRIAYLGKILDEHATLISQGWKEGSILNGLVVNTLP